MINNTDLLGYLILIKQILNFFTLWQLINFTLGIWTIINILDEVRYRKKSRRSLKAPYSRLNIMIKWLIGSTIMLLFDIDFINYFFLTVGVLLWASKYKKSEESREVYIKEKSSLIPILNKVYKITFKFLEELLQSTFERYKNMIKNDNKK